jgi:hemerythrin superfamily protein
MASANVVKIIIASRSGLFFPSPPEGSNFKTKQLSKHPLPSGKKGDSIMTPRSAGQTHARQSKAKSKTSGREKAGTFFDILKEDHEKVMSLFEQIEEGEEMEVEEMGDIFSQIQQELEAHMDLEESYFYPVLEESDETRQEALEAYEEHKVAKLVLNDFGNIGQDDERWKAKLKVLKELVEHHVQEEEGNVFKMAKKVIDKDQIQEITENIEQQKSSMHAQA